METEVQTEMGNALTQILEKRWSPRAFSDERIPRETLKEIFNTGKQVASSYNEQPWSVMLTEKDSVAYEKLYKTLIEFNQSWVETAPYLGVVLSKKHFSDQDKENKHCFYDTGAFMAVATLRATTLDIFIHQMAGFSPGAVKTSFKIPDDYEAITMFALGKIGEVNQLPKDLQEKEDPYSERKKADEFLFFDHWGEAL